MSRGLGDRRACVIAFAAVLCAADARADDTASIESYARSTDAQSCPDEAAFRAAVTERLGREPFATSATHAVRANLRRRGDWFALELSIDGATRTVRARRCDDAVRAAALTVAIALDPAIALGGPSRVRPATPREPLALPPVMPPGFRENVAGPTQIDDPEHAPPVVLWDADWVRPPPPPLRATELATGLGARLGLAMGVGDTLVRPAFSLGVGVVRDRWSFALETVVDLPGSQRDRTRNARVSGLAATATLLGCRGTDASFAPFLCLRATGGALVAWGSGYVTDFTVALPIVSAGARVGADVDLGHGTALRLGIDGDFVILRSSLLVEPADGANGASVFRSPPLALSFWLGARTWIF